MKKILILTVILVLAHSFVLAQANPPAATVAPDAGLMPTPAPKSADPNKIVAKIDGDPIYAWEVEEKVTGFTDKFREVSPNMQFSDDRLSQMRKEFLDRLLKERIMQKAASAEKIAVTDAEIDERISQFQKIFGEGPEAQQRFLGGIKDMKKFRTEVSKQIVVDKFVDTRTKELIKVTDDEIKTFYQTNTDKFAQPESVLARQLLLKVPPKEAADYKDKHDAALKKAEVIAKDVQSGKKFEDLARENSEDSQTAAKGGDLGAVTRGKLQKELEDALFALNVGEVSKPIETPTGIYVFQAVEKNSARTLTLEESSEKIRKGLESRKKEEAREKLYNEIKSKMKIETML